MRFNKDNLYDNLTEAFIRYLYRVENPMPSPTETREVMIEKYRNDPVFYSKVRSLTSGVMRVIEDTHNKG